MKLTPRQQYTQQEKEYVAFSGLGSNAGRTSLSITSLSYDCSLGAVSLDYRITGLTADTDLILTLVGLGSGDFGPAANGDFNIYLGGINLTSGETYEFFLSLLDIGVTSSVTPITISCPLPELTISFSDNDRFASFWVGGFGEDINITWSDGATAAGFDFLALHAFATGSTGNKAQLSPVPDNLFVHRQNLIGVTASSAAALRWFTGTYSSIVTFSGVEFGLTGLRKVDLSNSSSLNSVVHLNSMTELYDLDFSNCSLTGFPSTQETSLLNVNISYNSLPSSTINAALIERDNIGITSGIFIASHQFPLAPPTDEGLTAMANLLAKGWIVEVDGFIKEMSIDNIVVGPTNTEYFYTILGTTGENAGTYWWWREAGTTGASANFWATSPEPDGTHSFIFENPAAGATVDIQAYLQWNGPRWSNIVRDVYWP